MRDKKIVNYFISFLLGSLAYFLYLFFSQMIGGKYSVLTSDSFDGYIPAVKWIYESIKRGDSIAYNWSSYLGINSYVGLSSSLVLGVSTPIYFLFHELDFSTITVISLVIKAGLASLSFYVYVKIIWNVNDMYAMVFGIFYSLCGFQVAYIPSLLNFSDAIFMLPIILYFVSVFSDSGKFRIMIFAYAYLFLNFFYTGYIIGFFSLFYLILYMTFIKRYNILIIIKKLLFFLICIIIASGLTAIILFPTALFLMTKYADDATAFSGHLGVYPHDIYNQLFIGQNKGILSQYPYIYCGIPTLLLFPFYFFNKKIDRYQKIFFGSLVIIIFSSFLVPILYIFWHCFDAPDSFAYRFAFLFSFILCTIASVEAEHINALNLKKALLLVVFNGVFYLLNIYFQPMLQDSYSYYPNNTYKYFVINIFYMFLYLLFVYICKKCSNLKKYRTCLADLAIVICISEVVINGYSVFFKSPELNPTNVYSTYKKWDNTVTQCVNDINNDSHDFFRLYFENDYITNGPVYFGYYGISSFSNLENYEVRKTLGKLGLFTSPRIIYSTGLTDFTRMILDIEYYIPDMDYRNNNNYSDNVVVYRVSPCLSLGFLVDDKINDFKFAGNNQFENINDLASCIIGENVDIYSIYKSDFQYEEYGIKVLYDDNGKMILASEGKNDGNYDSLIISVPADDRKAYVEFDNEESKLDYAAPLFYNPGSGNFTYDSRISAQCIIPMDKINDKYCIGILMGNGIYKTINAPNIYFAYYNQDEIFKVYDKLKDCQMNVCDYGNGWVDAHIDINEDGKVLFTSIPYDKGWEIKANGEKIEAMKLIEGAFIGLNLPKGSYDIEFRYHVPGFKVGLLISVVSMIIMIALSIVNPIINIEAIQANVKK